MMSKLTDAQRAESERAISRPGRFRGNRDGAFRSVMIHDADATCEFGLRVSKIDQPESVGFATLKDAEVAGHYRCVRGCFPEASA